MNALTSRAPCARPNSLPPHMTPPIARRSSRERPLLRLPSSLLRQRLASETELSSPGGVSLRLPSHRSPPFSDDVSHLRRSFLLRLRSSSIRTSSRLRLPEKPACCPPFALKSSPSLHSRLSPHARVRLPRLRLCLPSFSGSVFPPVSVFPSSPAPSSLPSASLLSRVQRRPPVFLRSPSCLPLPSFQPSGWPACPCPASCTTSFTGIVVNVRMLDLSPHVSISHEFQ
ncbi:hypothetical protein ACLOJK_028014 [Asimina triloba]